MDLINKYHFYINLSERTEKNKHTINELKRFGISKPNRFEAIKHEIGLVGCVKSHIKCIEIAKERDYPFICIFEDDIIFRNINKCREMINKYINTDYDVLYLGAWIKDNNYEFITDDLIHIRKACCAHAYIVKKHYYDILLQNYYEGMNLKIKNPDNNSYNIDEYLVNLQKAGKWYLLNPHFVSQKNGYSDNFKEERNLYDEIFKIPVHDSLLPYISLLTPTFNRKKFIPLMIYNIQHFRYPKEKIEWNILESNDKNIENYENLFDKQPEYLEKFLGIKIKYIYMNKSLTIGKKRNILCGSSSHDYLINMDDDDIYLPEYINSSIDILLNNDKDITGCLDMLFVYPEKEYKTSYIRCVRDYKLYHEATMCMKRDHWKKYKYESSSKGEGKTIFGDPNRCDISNIFRSMICVCWEGNTINKDKFLEHSLDIKIHGDSLNILKNILNQKEIDIINDNKTIEISIDLLKNIRNLIEIINTRISWKTDELLPVGLMIKQIDELLNTG